MHRLRARAGATAANDLGTCEAGCRRLAGGTSNSFCSCSGTRVARAKRMATRRGDTGSNVASTVNMPRIMRKAVKLKPTSFTCAARRAAGRAPARAWLSGCACTQ